MLKAGRSNTAPGRPRATRTVDVAPPTAEGTVCVAQTRRDRTQLGWTKNLSHRWRMLEHWAHPRPQPRLRSVVGVLSIAAIVVNVPIARTETAQLRTRATTVAIRSMTSTTARAAPWRLPQPVQGKTWGRTTMLAVPRPVSRAEADKAAGWEDAPGGDVPPSQAVEVESNERGWHRPLATMVGRATAT